MANNHTSRVENLLAGHKLNQQKKKAMQAQRIFEEMKEVTGVPQINSKSKKLAAANEKLQKQKILGIEKQNKNKTFERSLMMTPLEQPNGEEMAALSSTLRQPSSKQPMDPEATFNGIQWGLEEPETQHPAPKEKDFYSRTLNWKKQKEGKLEDRRWKNQLEEVENCTFKPSISSPSAPKPVQKPTQQKQSSYKTVQNKRRQARQKAESKPERQKDSEERLSIQVSTISEYQQEDIRKNFVYQKISPVPKPVRYREGFNLNSFMQRAQPMVDYSKLTEY